MNLFHAAMAWMDELWDDDASLLCTVKPDRHMVRETAWYALGLLQRGDVERASRALDAVIGYQYDAPGAPFDGTFRRAPEEPDPPSDPVMWIHYDPNWRQFIGTTFAIICDTYELDAGLDDRVRTAIRRAVDTEPPGRVAPTYANIALMKAWLDAWSGDGSEADAFATDIASHFREHGAFLEYNSPTYYGIDLFALALWRSSTPTLRALGADMERTLWRDIARFYHPGLRNMCGPFDRSYGMDTTSYATPLGLQMAQVSLDPPFPDPAKRFGHPHDFCFAPLVVAFDVCVPDDANLSTFDGERVIEQTVSRDPDRVATAWLSDDVMLGGWSGPASGIGFYQHRHATMHWRTPEGGVGWAALRPEVIAEAVAERGALRITTHTDQPITFDVSDADVPFAIDTNANGPVTSDGAVVYEPSAGATTFVVAPS